MNPLAPYIFRESTPKVTCTHCLAQVTCLAVTPPAMDIEAWDMLHDEHVAGCEWVLARAHRGGAR